MTNSYQFGERYRKYHKSKDAQLRRSGLGIFRKVRRFLRKVYFFLVRR
jgi:hypothetical protein